MLSQGTLGVRWECTLDGTPFHHTFTHMGNLYVVANLTAGIFGVLMEAQVDTEKTWVGQAQDWTGTLELWVQYQLHHHANPVEISAGNIEPGLESQYQSISFIAYKLTLFRLHTMACFCVINRQVEDELLCYFNGKIVIKSLIKISGPLHGIPNPVTFPYLIVLGEEKETFICYMYIIVEFFSSHMPTCSKPGVN